jgi:hypothetical protein
MGCIMGCVMGCVMMIRGVSVKTAVTITLALVLGVRLAAAAEDVLPPSIVHEACEQYKKGQSFEIRARFLDDSAIFDPKVIYRSGSEFWKNAPFVREVGTEDFKALIRVKDLKGPLEYFIEVFDENGNGPARYGSPDAPVKVMPAIEPAECQQIGKVERTAAVRPSSSGAGGAATIGAEPATAGAGSTGTTAGAAGSQQTALIRQPPPPPPQGTCDRADRPIYCSPWLWGAAGAVVLGGGGVVAYVLLRKKDTATGPVRLRISAPDPTTLPLVRFP